MKKILLISIILLAITLFLIEKNSGPIVSQNGISTVKLTDDLISKYDQNSDDELNVADESFLRTETNDVVKTESRGLLFTDADNFGNADGSVTKVELKDYLDEFDTDNDSELTTYKNIFESVFNGKSEWAKFDEKYGERFKYESAD